MSEKIAAGFFVPFPNLCDAYKPVSHAARPEQNSSKAARTYVIIPVTVCVMVKGKIGIIGRIIIVIFPPYFLFFLKKMIATAAMTATPAPMMINGTADVVLLSAYSSVS